MGPYKGETTALYASAKAKLKINELFSIYGKLGVSRNSTSCFKSVDLPMQANVATTLVYSSTCHTTGVFSAFGAEYKITENTAVGAEYTNFNRILPFSSHANLLSLNVHFYF
ncbi:opacity protein-like surface antigen [Undibacterium sp. GrIS 1.8]